MPSATARLPLAPHAAARAPRVRVWRPFPREMADIVGVEERGGKVRPRMHVRFGISLVRSPAVLTVESRRDVIADRNCVILNPGFHLHGLRPARDAAEGPVTLLLGNSHLEGLSLPDHAALVSDPELGENTAALIAQLLLPVQSVEHATRIGPLLQQLLKRSRPLGAGRVRRSSALAPLRNYLQSHVSEPVATGELARMSGLTECHLIRAFHYEFGLPPHAYHLRLRLALACERLTRGLAVANVAYQCGFADQSHLTRKMKQVYGVTPAAWAASAKAGPEQLQREFGVASSPMCTV